MGCAILWSLDITLSQAAVCKGTVRFNQGEANCSVNLTTVLRGPSHPDDCQIFT